MPQSLEAERMAALRRYRVLDTPPEERFDRVTALAADLFSVPTAVISLIDTNRQWFKSCLGLDETETPRDVAFCDHAIRSDEIMVVSDATADPRFAENPFVTEGGVRFYVGAPLITPTGQRVGTLCVIDYVARPAPSGRELERLRTLAKVVVEMLEARLELAERQRLQREAEERLSLLELSESVAKVGHWRLDLKTNRITWSDEIFRIYGLDPQSFDPNLNYGLHAYDEEGRRHLQESLREAIELGESYDYQGRLRRTDGEWRDVISRAVCEKDEDGKVTAVFGVFQDVTERERSAQALRTSEQRYRLLADNVDDIIATIGIDGLNTYVSPACEKVIGYRPSDLVGVSSLTLVHPGDVDAVRATYLALLRGEGGEGASVEYRARHRDGGWVWLEGHPSLLTDERSGAAIGYVDVVRDITARKATEAELEEAMARAEAAARSKASFLANMSHEIRTPMNGVVGFADLLAESELDGEQRRCVGHIQQASATLMELLNDILDFSKIEAGRMDISTQPFDLKDALEGSLQLLSAPAQQKGLDLRIDLHPRLPARVAGDSLRLRQILLNLLGNAIKFTASGSVALSAKPSGPASVRLTVADTGVGIAPDRLANIFEEFVQADSTTARRFGGSGLGLTISQRLARLMGGDLTVESIEDVGTTVILDLPLPEVETDASEPAPSVARAEAPGPAPSGEGGLILVVDDVEMNRELVARILGKAGYAVETAESGEAALRRMAEGGYDLVLMDVQMPGLDGLTVTRLIRSCGGPGAATPILALTANAMAQDVADCLNAGMDGHLAKPIRAPELLAKVAAHLAPPEAEPAAPPSVTGDPAMDEDHEIADLEARFAQRLDQAVGELEELRARQGEAPSDDLRRFAHTLAGTAGMLGFPGVGEAASRLEHAVREDGDVEAAAEALAVALRSR